MFVGTLVHELLQACLTRQCKTMEDIQMQVEECLKSPDIQNGMLLLGVQEEEIRRELEPFLPHIHFFIQR